MTVADAIARLKTLDAKAVLVIQGVVVEHIEDPIPGRIKDGYGKQYFTPVEKGREKAVRFSASGETSDGVMRQLPF